MIGGKWKFRTGKGNFAINAKPKLLMRTVNR